VPAESQQEKPFRSTSGAEMLRTFHDEASPIGACRRINRPASEDDQDGGVLFDFDPTV
jgi:hypothetical protein